MNIAIVQVVALFLAVAFVSSDTIQLEPTQGILIPAPVAHTLRFARSAYGGNSASYSAPAAPAYSAPAWAAPAYSAPAASAFSAPASIQAPPCPRNYLFSCQPSLSPVACSSSNGGYQAGPAHSYSAPSSSYSAPSSSYSAPSSSYSAPSSSYSAPSSSYSAPFSSYSAPSSAPASPSGAYSHLYPQYALPYVKELY